MKGKKSEDVTQEHLWALIRKLPSDFAPSGQRDRPDYGPDWSCAYKHLHKLAGERWFDWGICANARSPRAGLLAFELMGCKELEGDEYHGG